MRRGLGVATTAILLCTKPLLSSSFHLNLLQGPHRSMVLLRRSARLHKEEQSGLSDGGAAGGLEGDKKKRKSSAVELENDAGLSNKQQAPRPPRKKATAAPPSKSEDEPKKKSKQQATKGGKQKKKKEDDPVDEETQGLSPDKERRLHAQGYDFVYGIDEAGRGPLAGPVVAAACYVPPDIIIPGIRDSKQMNEEEREKAFEALMTTEGVLHAVSIVDNKRIDEINILQATLQGMRESLDQRLQKHRKDHKIYAMVDGNRDPGLGVDAELVIKGDSKVRCIAAASIIAKVTRDRIMLEHHEAYPQYNFKQHKGYPTPAHKAAIHQHGPCPLHRMTFKPIKKD